MAECLYTVKDRETGEILCQGSSQECADFLGCEYGIIQILARKEQQYKYNTKWSMYKIERQVFGEIKNGGAHKKDVICCDCGLLMKSVSASRKRCPECQRKHTLKRKRDRMREARGTTAVHRQNKNKNKAYCDGCVYFFGYYDINKCCNYIFIKGKQRPCPSGKECTERVERKGYREKEK